MLMCICVCTLICSFLSLVVVVVVVVVVVAAATAATAAAAAAAASTVYYKYIFDMVYVDNIPSYHIISNHIKSYCAILCFIRMYEDYSVVRML